MMPLGGGAGGCDHTHTQTEYTPLTTHTMTITATFSLSVGHTGSGVVTKAASYCLHDLQNKTLHNLWGGIKQLHFLHVIVCGRSHFAVGYLSEVIMASHPQSCKSYQI